MYFQNQDDREATCSDAMANDSRLQLDERLDETVCHGVVRVTGPNVCPVCRPTGQTHLYTSNHSTFSHTWRYANGLASPVEPKARFRANAASDPNKFDGELSGRRPPSLELRGLRSPHTWLARGTGGLGRRHTTEGRARRSQVTSAVASVGVGRTSP